MDVKFFQMDGWLADPGVQWHAFENESPAGWGEVIVPKDVISLEFIALVCLAYWMYILFDSEIFTNFRLYLSARPLFSLKNWVPFKGCVFTTVTEKPMVISPAICGGFSHFLRYFHMEEGSARVPWTFTVDSYSVPFAQDNWWPEATIDLLSKCFSFNVLKNHESKKHDLLHISWSLAFDRWW